jgi:Tol biopolymer transport system component
VRTGVPKELERITDKCLAKDAEERYQHVTDLLVDLQACRRALEPGTPKSSARATPVNRATLAAAGATVVLAGLGLAWWLTRSSETAAPPQYTLIPITRDTGYTADPALSPSGQLLAYASDRQGDGNLDIWVQQLTGGGNPVRLTQHEADDYESSFSPDGSRVVFSSRRDGGGIYVVPALGGNPRRITDPGDQPRFSTSGEWISYTQGKTNSKSQVFRKLYLAPVSGGQPEVLETGLAWASSPVWSPDGKQLLFAGTVEPSVHGRPVTYDWWVLPVEGGKADRLETNESFEQVRVPFSEIQGGLKQPHAWLQDGNWIVFSGAVGDGATNLWRVRISPEDARVLGEPQRLTAGTGESDPSVSRDGRIAFVTSTTDRDIWSLPIDANRAEVQGELERVVLGLSDDACTSISGDGRKLAYTSDRSGNFDIWLRALESGKDDTQITVADTPDSRGEISDDGTRIAFRRANPDGTGDVYIHDVRRGGEKLIIEGVINYMDWTPDEKRLLFYTPPPLRWMTADVEMRQLTEVALSHPEHGVSNPRYSPDGDWLTFILRVEGTGFQLLISRVEGGHPWWSPDANTLYFLSERDGSLCIWYQSLNRDTKRPEGPVEWLRHFHGRLRPSRGSAFGYAMTGDRLYLPLRDTRSNIWLAEPVEEQAFQEELHGTRRLIVVVCSSLRTLRASGLSGPLHPERSTK